MSAFQFALNQKLAIERFIAAHTLPRQHIVTSIKNWRLHLIDDRIATAVVAVPEQLIEQWERELSGRIGLERDDRVTVCAIQDALSSVREAQPRMLVIDGFG